MGAVLLSLPFTAILCQFPLRVSIAVYSLDSYKNWPLFIFASDESDFQPPLWSHNFHCVEETKPPHGTSNKKFIYMFVSRNFQYWHFFRLRPVFTTTVWGFVIAHGFEMVCVHTQNLPWTANQHINVGCNGFGNQFHGFQITTAVVIFLCVCYTEWYKKRELLKNAAKIEEIQEKKFIDRSWTITTYLLRDSNPNYQCLKITSCRWRSTPRMHFSLPLRI